MNYYGANDWRDYHLAHWGVKGMKWHKHLKAATDWWSKNVTGDYYLKKRKDASNQAGLNVTRQARYYNKAQSFANDKDSFRGFSGELRRKALSAKYRAKSAAESAKAKYNFNRSDAYYEKHKANKTIGQKIKETPGNIGKKIKNAYRTKITGDAHYAGTHPSAVAVRNAKYDINKAKEKRETEKRRNKYIVGNRPIDKIKAARDMRDDRRYGTYREAARDINKALQGSQVIAGAKRKADKALLPRTKKAINGAGKKVKNGAKKIGKAFADNARSNGRKFKEFTKTHTPKADKAIRSGVKRVQKVLGRLTGKSTTTAKSSSNRPHSRKPKIASGTANVEKRKNLASRPHSRKPKIASGTAQVKKKRRVTYG